MTEKPLLLIDVDGPLNPYANSHNQLRKGKVFHPYKLLGFKVWLSRWHGEELLKLADLYDLVWCTTWEHDANSLIGPRIGLPRLPVIEFNKTWKLPTRADGTYFKTHEVAKWVTGRPFAWVDDEVSQWDDAFFQDVCEAPYLLRKIDPVVGLADEDFVALRAWAEGVASDRAA
jgi:hypothetical protein